MYRRHATTIRTTASGLRIHHLVTQGRENSHKTKVFSYQAGIVLELLKWLGLRVGFIHRTTHAARRNPNILRYYDGVHGRSHANLRAIRAASRPAGQTRV